MKYRMGESIRKSLKSKFILICSATIDIKRCRLLMKMNPWKFSENERTKKLEFYFSFSLPIMPPTMPIPKAPPLPSFLSNNSTPVILTTQFPSVTPPEPTTLPPLPPTTNKTRKSRPVIVERRPSMTVNEPDTSAVRIEANIEIGRLQMKDLAERELTRLCERHYQDLLEEVIQSDTEKPSIPEVILAVITELTNDEDEFNENSNYRTSIEPFNQDTSYSTDDTELYYPPMQPVTTNALRSTNSSDQSHFSTSDEVQMIENQRKIKSIFRLEQHAVEQYGRLDDFLHPMVNKLKLSQQKSSNLIMIINSGLANGNFATHFYLSRNNSFLSSKEAYREFRRLYHLEEKRRQQLLNRHEYEIDEQRSEFHRKRQELIQHYEFELRTLEDKFQAELEREKYLFSKKSRLNKDDESARREKHFINQQHQQRLVDLEKRHEQNKEILFRDKERDLGNVDEHELHSRYELLRKQTKAFYALFRTMLTQQFEKEFHQLDQQIHFERENLQAQLADDRREWPKNIQKTRNRQLRQKLVTNKIVPETQRNFVRKVEIFTVHSFVDVHVLV